MIGAHYKHGVRAYNRRVGAEPQRDPGTESRQGSQEGNAECPPEAESFFFRRQKELANLPPYLYFATLVKHRQICRR